MNKPPGFNINFALLKISERLLHHCKELVDQITSNVFSEKDNFSISPHINSDLAPNTLC